MKEVVDNVVGTALNGGDVAKAVVDANLPFQIETLSDDREDPADKLERILIRSKDGKVDTVKKDPEFNAFLKGVVDSIERNAQVKQSKAAKSGENMLK